MITQGRGDCGVFETHFSINIQIGLSIYNEINTKKKTRKQSYTHEHTHTRSMHEYVKSIRFDFNFSTWKICENALPGYTRRSQETATEPTLTEHWNRISRKITCHRRRVVLFSLLFLLHNNNLTQIKIIICLWMCRCRRLPSRPLAKRHICVCTAGSDGETETSIFGARWIHSHDIMCLAKCLFSMTHRFSGTLDSIFSFYSWNPNWLETIRTWTKTRRIRSLISFDSVLKFIVDRSS